MTDLRQTMHMCEHCRAHTELHYVEHFDEYWCDNCIQSAAESAYERYCEDFHDGGCTSFNSLEQQAEAARKLK